MPHSKPQPPRAVTKDTAKAVIVVFPDEVVDAVNRAVINEDTDRSKWIRKAVREALENRGVEIPAHV